MRTFQPIRVQRPRATVIALATVVGAMVLWHSVWLPMLLDQNLSTASPVPLLCITALPVLLLTGVLFALTGRIVLAMCLASALLALLFLASAIKMEHLGIPLQASDLLIFGNGGISADLLHHYASFTQRQLLVALLLLTILLLCLRFEPRVLSRGSRAAVLLLMVGTTVAAQRPDSILGRQVHADWVRIIPWSPQTNVARNGLLANLNKEFAQLTVPVPAPSPGFTMPAAAAAPQLSDPLPDIVVVMSESYFRPDTLQQVPECFATPNYCALRERSVWGNLAVPAFGGATLRTEFEFLTGMSLANFPQHSYPYLSLVRGPLPSLAWDLKQLGYRSLAIHPFKRTFWNRHAVYPLLGFDEFRSRASFGKAELSGYYISDTALTRSIREELATPDPAPRFIFAISMENHGPWGRRPNIDEQRVAAISAPAALPQTSTRAWQEFIYHLENADRQLGELAAIVDSYPRPAVLLFFGDHLPGLKGIYETLSPKTAATHRSIPTPYLMISNQPLQARQVDTFAYRLGNLVLANLGLCHNAYCLEERRVASAGKSTSAQLRELHLWRYHQRPAMPATD